MSALWFHINGIGVFPIKQRDKVPACPSWDDHQATINEVKAFTNYGVALGPFGVLDTDTPETEAWAQLNAPPTPFIVKTGRGTHRYYRLLAAAPHFIHRDGHTIEFRNFGQYVVGPGSIHSSGAVYEAQPWSWNVQDIPFFPVHDFQWEDRAEGTRGSADGEELRIPDVIQAGERHDMLFKFMRSLQARGLRTTEQLMPVLRAENAAKCQPPISDEELRKYIPRAAKYKDRPDFTRIECADAATMAGSLIEIGASVDAAIAAAKVIDPSFDPSGNTEDVRPIVDAPRVLQFPPRGAHAEIADLEAEIAQLKKDAEESDVVDDWKDTADLEIVDGE